MATHSYWEPKVGDFLRPRLAYLYKPVDSIGHGGAARLDYLGTTKSGRFCAVEVKACPVTRKMYNPNIRSVEGLSVLQARALDAIVKAVNATVLVIVGRGRDALYWFNWRDLRDKNKWSWDMAMAVSYVESRGIAVRTYEESEKIAQVLL